MGRHEALLRHRRLLHSLLLHLLRSLLLHLRGSRLCLRVISLLKRWRGGIVCRLLGAGVACLLQGMRGCVRPSGSLSGLHESRVLPGALEHWSRDGPRGCHLTLR